MAYLIDKDTLVAEIKRRMDKNRGKQSLPQYFGMMEEDLNILSFIDTIEVKEVDLEKEMQRQMNGARVDVTSFCQEVPEDIARVVADHFDEML